VTPYAVTLEVFEGPLDLLLTLVRRSELDIGTVALARVTSGYLNYLAGLEEIDPGALAEFCEVAATLLFIKSRTLLPRPPEPPPDEEADALALVERLREYRRYREAADALAQRQTSGLRAYARAARPVELPPRLEPGEVSVDQLAAAFEAALAEIGRREPVLESAPAVQPYRFRLSERLQDIRVVLLRHRSVAFHDLLMGDRLDREFVIVSFLAVLELLRRADVRAVQAELFGEIHIELMPEVAERWEREPDFVPPSSG